MRTYKIRKGKFHRDRLPPPLIILKQLGIRPDKPNSRGYWQFRCPFHKNGQEVNPSFNLHKIEGHYRCHACGIKGGDILEFYRQVTRKPFIEAALDLGAWEEAI